jgi:hypothetical protein
MKFQQHAKVANGKLFWDVCLNSWALILELSQAPFLLKPYLMLELIAFPFFECPFSNRTMHVDPMVLDPLDQPLSLTYEYR